ncbi:hypothetical protein VIGAN_02132600 [Vigna angularis var. angularis]|uniref:Uncharacterized protein n=1 Tax=Vigna angularis var. angularis TaxID=157739 RepID=A0A0S3RDQ5_PHAAN|nr:hypothetical protein VIGAN_02132600 [Vigna angularis var. angularis]
MRVETFHHAEKDKVEHYILELLVWLYRLVIKSKARSDTGKGFEFGEFLFGDLFKLFWSVRVVDGCVSWRRRPRVVACGGGLWWSGKGGTVVGWWSGKGGTAKVSREEENEDAGHNRSVLREAEKLARPIG